jgi:hypothetical protein
MKYKVESFVAGHKKYSKVSQRQGLQEMALTIRLEE